MSASLASPEDEKKTNRVTQDDDRCAHEASRGDRGHRRHSPRLGDSRRTYGIGFVQHRPHRVSAGGARCGAVRLGEQDDGVDPLAITYINRLSDLLWLFGRLVENDAGMDGKLRDGKGGGWSKA